MDKGATWLVGTTICLFLKFLLRSKAELILNVPLLLPSILPLTSFSVINSGVESILF